jgi:hypothetical protein
MNRLRINDAPQPRAKHHFIQGIKIRLRERGWKVVNSFRDSTLAVKVYVIGWILFAATYPLILSVPNAYKYLAFVSLALSLMLAAVGLCLELYDCIRGLWGTTRGKVLFGVFSFLIGIITTAERSASVLRH